VTDREIDNKLWCAFLLGARVVADQNGKQLSLSDIDALGEAVRRIAQNEVTLEDPTTMAAKSPEIGELLLRLDMSILRSNRDLSRRIFEGFKIATEVDG
jgi:hypothetical protein